MGYRELLLVLVSVVLLTLLMTQINSQTVEGREALQELSLHQAAASLAQQFIEEARSKKFDALVGVLAPGDMPDGFTPWNWLGHSGSESYPRFNDVDDYHGFSRTIYVNGANTNLTGTDGIPFNVNIQVHYVSEANPDSAVSHETFLKRMTVNVTSSWLPTGTTVTLKHVFSYFGVNM
ncbi:MAG: hypothetical protein ONB48_09275 [candidate division KSB1 bacterium]|nr:hypothetical protein [candidate division KSB1 bacterium]MDZ7273678.1 hypothetical protein [candidate division KSB1 bacterium]MDZ7285834.1 hypothetical protein [candidate division KSB1 bacterium]MDZ7298866.1 hypothetical protein [candidate division KSB1 bacterium]MDZ7307088.1 hypothetical protein [candidate division KSB1 bacterium]